MAKVYGPECPRCECPDTEVVGERMVFGQRRERCQCAFCGHLFTAGGLTEGPPEGAARDETAELEAAAEDEERVGVAYNAAPPRCQCPKCKARNPPVKRTCKEDGGRTVRYHRCECGLTFKSIEEVSHG